MKLILYTSQLKSVGGVSSQNVGVGGKGPLNVDVGGLDDVNPKNFDMGPFHYIVIPYVHFICKLWRGQNYIQTLTLTNLL